MSDSSQSNLIARLTYELDHASDIPLHRQLSDRIMQEVLEGQLESGERLPTVRQLAIELSIHPSSVERAYHELEVRGVLATHQGEGTYVSIRQADDVAIDRSRKLEQLCTEIVSRARSLGLSLDDVIETLAEVRSAGRSARER